MSRLGFQLLHWFWLLFSPTYRHEMALQDDAQNGRAHLVHHMSEWPQNWRHDRALMERVCPHGVGHPDPDHVAYVRRAHGSLSEGVDVHGCDGCCRQPGAVVSLERR